MNLPVDYEEPMRLWNTVSEGLTAYLSVFPKYLDPKRDFSKRVIDATIEGLSESLAQRVRLLMKCESPIECLFALALNDVIPHQSAEEAVKGEFVLANPLEDRIGFTPWPLLLAQYPAPAYATPTTWDNQVTLNCNGNTYRADFLFTTQLGDEEFRVVVELDGHEFHEKTKEQAVRDKKRDRDMMAAGIRVLRFTGSEVWRDPHKCAVEALANVNLAAIDWLNKVRRIQNEDKTQEA